MPKGKAAKDKSKKKSYKDKSHKKHHKDKLKKGHKKEKSGKKHKEHASVPAPMSVPSKKSKKADKKGAQQGGLQADPAEGAEHGVWTDITQVKHPPASHRLSSAPSIPRRTSASFRQAR
jgi:hypothetical protein